MEIFHLPVLVVLALGCAPLFAQAPPATKTPQQGETWTRDLADPVQRGKLQDAFQFVRGDTGKWSDEPKLLCAMLTDKPSKTSLDDWFDQMERRRNAPPRADEDAWLLFRTRQFDDNDRIWIERIERRGNRISVVMNEAIWQGKYFKTFTFYQTYGINLGKLAPGEYSVDWTIRSRTFRQFAGEGKPTPENWPKDDEPAEKEPVVISTTISVAGEPPKVGAASERRESATELARVDQLWAADGPGGTPSFVKHVVPLFNKVGCSNRSCHGSFQGQGGFLPSVFQGTVVRYKEPRIANLTPMAHLRGAPQESALALLERMNRRHQARRPHNDDLAARTASFQLAARMQLAAADALDFSQETAATRRMYGLDDPLLSVFAANCLLARRLVERGVRFVQVYTRSQFWDQHVRLIPELPVACRRTINPPRHSSKTSSNAECSTRRSSIGEVKWDGLQSFKATSPIKRASAATTIRKASACGSRAAA